MVDKTRVSPDEWRAFYGPPSDWGKVSVSGLGEPAYVMEYTDYLALYDGVAFSACVRDDPEDTVCTLVVSPNKVTFLPAQTLFALFLKELSDARPSAVPQEHLDSLREQGLLA